MQKIGVSAVVVIALNLGGVITQAQESKSNVILFHVTSVQRTDNSAACQTESCSAMKYTIEGFVSVSQVATKTQYVITCDEFKSNRPFPHRNNICARFHAGEVYTAEMQSDRVSFPNSRLNKAFETDYRIVAEKEIPKGPDDRETAGTVGAARGGKRPTPGRSGEGAGTIGKRGNTLIGQLQAGA